MRLSHNVCSWFSSCWYFTWTPNNGMTCVFMTHKNFQVNSDFFCDRFTEYINHTNGKKVVEKKIPRSGSEIFTSANAYIVFTEFELSLIGLTPNDFALSISITKIPIVLFLMQRVKNNVIGKMKWIWRVKHALVPMAMQSSMMKYPQTYILGMGMHLNQNTHALARIEQSQVNSDFN